MKRVCKKCGDALELNESNFRPHTPPKSGFRHTCRTCGRKYVNPSVCSVEGCDGAVDSYGMCGKHAQRMRRYGDASYVTPKEESAARIRETQLSRTTSTGKAYKKFFGRHEHRVVAETMIGRKLLPGEIVHHVDGNKLNNDPDNLVVVSQAEHVRLHRRRMQG